MKRILFALAAIAVLAVGGFALLSSAHADGGTSSGASCVTSKC